MPLRALAAAERPREILAGQQDAPALRGDDADDRLQQRRLARAVAAEQRDDLVLVHLERRSHDDVTLAVERVDALEVEQQRRRPRARRDRAASRPAPRCPNRCRPRAPPGFRARRRRVPSIRTLPSFITVTRSASANTRSMSCSTSSTGRSAEMRLIRPPTRSRSAAARPASGSSSSSTRGAPASASPMSSRRCPPYDSDPASACSMPDKPEVADQLRRARRHALVALRRRSSRRSATRRAPARRDAGSRAIDTRGNRLVIWNERPRPAAAIRYGGKPAIDWPASTTDPWSGANMPVIRLNTVVLPAPLGPISACSVRSRTDERRVGHRLDAAERLREVARFQHHAAGVRRMLQELGQRHALLDRARAHRRGLDDLRLERLGQAPPYAHQSGRREHDERDEEQAEVQQPVRRPDRQVFLEQDVEQRAQRRAEQAAHAADDDHGEQRAGERDRRRVGRREAMMEREQHAGAAGQHRRHDVGDLLVAVGRVADELRALLVLADGDQHGADRRAVEALQRVHDGEPERRDQRVVDPGILEVDAEPGRARHAAESAFAAGERGPAKRDRVGQRRKREREQRKVDAAPAQHDEADGHGGGHQERQRQPAPATAPSRETSAAAPARRRRRPRRTMRHDRTTRAPCARPGC